jgi:hypothetical protein
MSLLQSMFGRISLLYSLLVLLNGTYSPVESSDAKLFNIDFKSAVIAHNGTPGSPGSSSITIIAPTVNKGDVLIAQIAVAKDFSPSNTICPPNGWISVFKNDFDRKIIQQLFYYIADSDEPEKSYTWHFKSNPGACNTEGFPLTGKGATGGILLYAGVDPVSPIDAVAGTVSESSGTIATAPSVKTTGNGSRLIHFFSAFKDLTFTTTNNRVYTAGSSNNSTERTAAAYHTTHQLAGSTASFNANLSNSAEWVSATIALRPDESADNPDAMIKISGDNQTGSINAELANPFVVAVLDEFNNPVPGVPIEFSIIDQPPAAGASLSTSATVTGTNGRASTYLTMGSQSGTYTVQAATQDIPSLTFTASLPSYRVSGVVTREGVGLAGVSVVAAGGHEQSVTTNGNGLYVLTEVVRGTSGITITPSLTGHIFSPASVTIADPVTGDISNQNFTAQMLTYMISGSVAGDTREDVRITISGELEGSVQTDSDGNYTVSGVPLGSTVTLTPGKNGFSFEPAQRTLSDISSNLRNQNFTSVRWKLSFAQQPTNTIAGRPIDPAVAVRVLDVRDDLVTGFTGQITLAIQNNPVDGTLIGTRQIRAEEGIATFSDLAIQRAGSGYTLRATAGGITQATSTGFIILPADAVRLIFTQEPTDSKAGQVFSSPVSVRAHDEFDNLATGFDGEMRITIGSNPSDGTLFGTNVLVARDGIATFDELYIDKTGNGYRLRAEADGVSAILSSTFNILPGEQAKLSFTQQPSTTRAGSLISPPMTVHVLDAGDNVVTDYSGSVSLVVSNNPGEGTLIGTTERRAASGRATFDDIVIEKAGSGYTVSALLSDAITIESKPFDITAAPAERLLISTGNNQEGHVNTRLPEPFTVRVIDPFENPVSGIGTSFSIISQPDDAESVLSDMNVLSDENGYAASFLTLGSMAGPYSVRVSVPGLEPVFFNANLPGFELSGSIESESDDDPSGITVTASGGYSMSTITDDSGMFSITSVPRGSESISITPRREGYGFIPASVEISGPLDEDIGGIRFVLTPATLVITGRVMYEGSGFGNTVMVATGGHNALASTDNNGEYTFTDVAYGASDVTVFPSHTGYRFTPASRTIAGPVIDDAVLNDFTATAQSFSISGRIMNNAEGLADVTVLAEGDYTNTVQTDANGRYHFGNVPYGATAIEISPSKDGYLFDPQVTMIAGPITGDREDVHFKTNPPTAPVLIDPSDTVDEQPNRMTFSWNAVTGAQYYNLWLSTDSTFTGPTVIEITGITATNYTVSDLVKGETFYWRVNASNLGGTGPWSEARQFSTSMSLKYIALVSPAEGDVWEEGTQYSIQWQSQDVKELRIDYSIDNGTTWNTVHSSIDAAQEQYIWTVPDTPTTEGRIRLTDIDDEDIISVSDVFTIYPVIVPVTYSVTFGNARTITSYRMIGLPGNTELHLTHVLSGEAGKDWTAFRDNGHLTNHLVEFDGSVSFSFRPGNGFWILSKNGLHVQHEVETVHLDPDKTFSIPLHTGWNIISNPFTIAVAWDKVKQTNDITDPLWDFDGRYIESDSLEPYKGYYVYNATELSHLKIPYPNSTAPAGVTKQSTDTPRSLSLLLEQEDRRSRPVRVHLFDAGGNGIERFIKHAPPGDFEASAITIQNELLSTSYVHLAEDARKLNRKGQTFGIEIYSIADKPAHLHIEGIDSFHEPVLALIDRNTGRRYDLRDGVIANVLTGIGRRNFVLIIGTETFMDGIQKTVLPEAYHLSNNFPNPFNPVTTIEYSIPGGSKTVPVKLEVYDLLGRRIRVLVDKEQNDGFYSVAWDGRNDLGETVASGVYIYVIRAGDFFDSKRMVIVK